MAAQQPTFVQEIDGSSAAAHSLTLTPGTATYASDMLLVGVEMTAVGTQSPQTVGGIIDSAGTPVVAGHSTGVPVNTWAFLGGQTIDGIRMEWWVCKGAVSITSLTINITGTGTSGLQAIQAVMLEYGGSGGTRANGVSFAVSQALQSNQNTITSQYILETAATYPNGSDGAAAATLMIGMFAMLNDTFNASPPTPAGATQTIRSTNSFSIAPAFSYQVIEQGITSQVGIFTASGERVVLAAGALNVTAESASQLATVANVAASSMQCLYVTISAGLMLNTPPGFNDQPDSALAAGQYALGSQLAKISGNAALGMCRMECFTEIYSNGETVELPVSTVDGYQYSMDELTFAWGIYSTASPSTGWITGPQALWYGYWNVDQETGLVTCIEWYQAVGSNGTSNDGQLQVFTIAQRQQQTLTCAESPSWTQQQASNFVTDLAYSTDVLTEMNDNAKFAVIGQECIAMAGPNSGGFANGDTVPRPVSPADDYEYAYSEVTFIFSWMWTTFSSEYIALPTFDLGAYGNLASMNAAINPSTGIVTCAVGMMTIGGVGYTSYNTLGLISVFALCQRARAGAPAVVADQFAELSNTLFYPGSDPFAYVGGQIVKNINEAALTPEFFGPTLYALGETIALPTSTVDGYPYQRSELTYIFEWAQMTPGPWPPGSGSNNRTVLFSAQIEQATGVITNTTSSGAGASTKYTSVIVRLEPGGPLDYETEPGGATNPVISVVVVGSRSAQQPEITQFGNTAPAGGSSVVDLIPPGPVTVNGV
jgi:hypothetical protein